MVTVEVHISNGLPSLSIVGLPEAAVKESKDRVRGALLNCRFEFPAQRITVNMAPADLPKEGGCFDLPIALGILAASGQIRKTELANYECVGELSLGGELRSIVGALPIAIQAGKASRKLILPNQNAQEAGLVQDALILPAAHLLEVCAHLNGQKSLNRAALDEPVFSEDESFDFADVQGHQHAKRALEVAAVGRHNLLMLGPPGTGKSMLAQRFSSILPCLNDAQALEVAALVSVSDHGFDPLNWRKPPFRNPHHTASAVAMVGGGSHPKPGEISLAHQGVLFLDELPEFDRKVLEVLREPMETGRITISRAARQVDFPADFQLIAAMNPCPCGFLGDSSGRCHCSSEQIQRYRGRISGPLLDRIDMHIEVQKISNELLREGALGGEETSLAVLRRVDLARQKAVSRCGKFNAALTVKQVKQFCGLKQSDQLFLARAVDRLGLSHRAYHRILKVSRSIADLAGSENIELPHLSEAVSYRRLDRL